MNNISIEDHREEMSHEMGTNMSKMVATHTLWLGLATTLAGVASAAVNHYFDPLMAFICLLFILLVQMTGNLLHCYCELVSRTGHVNMINYQVNDISPVVLYRKMAIACGIMALMVGLSIIAIEGWWLIIFGIAGIVLGYFYYFGPKPLVRTQYSIIITFLLFGPIGVFGVCFAQMPDALNNMDERLFLQPAFYMSIIAGLMAGSSQLTHHYYNYQKDLQTGRITLATLRGQRFTRRSLAFNGIIITALLVIMAFDVPGLPTYSAPWWLLVSMAFLFMVLRTYVLLRLPVSSRSFWGDVHYNVDIMSAVMLFVCAVAMVWTAYF